jgi:hypothetical protein
VAHDGLSPSGRERSRDRRRGRVGCRQLRDLRTGKARRRISSDGGPLCTGDRQATIGPILLTDYGGVLWVHNRQQESASVSTLWDWHDAYPTILDSDPGVLANLVLRSARVSWTRDGTARSAALTRSCSIDSATFRRPGSVPGRHA